MNPFTKRYIPVNGPLPLPTDDYWYGKFGEYFSIGRPEERKEFLYRISRYGTGDGPAPMAIREKIDFYFLFLENRKLNGEGCYDIGNRYGSVFRGHQGVLMDKIQYILFLVDMAGHYLPVGRYTKMLEIIKENEQYNGNVLQRILQS